MPAEALKNVYAHLGKLIRQCFLEATLPPTPSLVIAAQTLSKWNASHKILEKLGFRHVYTIDHPEDGVAWER